MGALSGPRTPCCKHGASDGQFECGKFFLFLDQRKLRWSIAMENVCPSIRLFVCPDRISTSYSQTTKPNPSKPYRQKTRVTALCNHEFECALIPNDYKSLHIVKHSAGPICVRRVVYLLHTNLAKFRNDRNDQIYSMSPSCKQLEGLMPKLRCTQQRNDRTHPV